MRANKENETLFSRAFSSLVWGLVSIKLMIFTAFLITLSHAGLSLADGKTGTGEKPPMICSGKNLLESLKRDDPKAFAKIEKAASNVANGGSKFWKVEKEGLAPSWLLGTMHFSDPRVVNLAPEVGGAFDGANTIIIENTQILDPKKLVVAMAEVRPMMFFTDGSTLEQRYGSKTIALIKKRLAGRNIPYFLGKRMQPWVLATAIVMPLCEIERKHAKKKVLDNILGSRAQKEGKHLVGLESVKEQISAMASLSLDFHLKSLEETVKLGSKMDDMMETMVVIYQQGNIGQFWPLMKYLSPKTAKSPGYAKFQEVLITKRNIIMAERSLPYLEKGNAFMAVGALHLPGEKGVVQLLQNAGYKVTPAL